MDNKLTVNDSFITAYINRVIPNNNPENKPKLKCLKDNINIGLIGFNNI